MRGLTFTLIAMGLLCVINEISTYNPAVGDYITSWLQSRRTGDDRSLCNATPTRKEM